MSLDHSGISAGWWRRSNQARQIRACVRIWPLYVDGRATVITLQQGLRQRAFVQEAFGSQSVRPLLGGGALAFPLPSWVLLTFPLPSDPGSFDFSRRS
jgi:hypothetical protein